MQSISTLHTIQPLAGLPGGFILPDDSIYGEIQQLLPDLQTGVHSALWLHGPSGSGKTRLATSLAQLLAQNGWIPLALAATPFQPLSTGRILAAFATLFLSHALHDEAKIVQNPLIEIKKRLEVVVAVLHHKLASVLVLDGLDNRLDPNMALFLADLLSHTNSLSRSVLTSHTPPILADLSSSNLHSVLLSSTQEKPLPKRTMDALAQLDSTQLATVAAMTTFHHPMPVAGYCAITDYSPAQQTDLLHQLAQQGLAMCHSLPGTLPLWYLHPLLCVTAKKKKHPLRAGKHQARAGEYLFHLASTQQQESVGLGWLDLSLEAVGHLIQYGTGHRQDLFPKALQYAAPVCEFFSRHGLFWEQERLNRTLLALREHPRPLYLLATALLKSNGEAAEARSLLERVLTFGDTLFPKETALALFELAALVLSQNPEEAREKLLQALSINQRIDDLAGQAVCHAHLGFWGLQQADIAVAQTHLEVALAMCRTLNDQAGIANLLPWTGELLWRLGHLVAARQHFQEALQLLHTYPNPGVEEQLHHRLAIMDLSEENFDSALAGLLRSLEIKRATKNQKGEAVTFFQLGRLAKAKGNEFASLRFLGLCHRISLTLGDPDAAQALTLFYELAATALGMHRAIAQIILDEVWAGYCKDSGQSLIAQSFTNG